MDLTHFVNMINYQTDPNLLIKELFRSEEEINVNAVKSYMKIFPKEVNQFNNSLDQYFFPYL